MRPLEIETHSCYKADIEVIECELGGLKIPVVQSREKSVFVPSEYISGVHFEFMQN